MSDLILFWHRRDLRISDNLGLAAARARSRKIVGVFCLDPLILDRDDVASARVKYLIGSLQSLQKRYAEAGSELLIIQADPKEGIPKLARSLNAAAVFFNQDVEPYGRDRDQSVVTALNHLGIEVQTFWDQLLHSPEEIKSGSGTPYTVYSPFWKNWSLQKKKAPAPDLAGVEGLTDSEREQAEGTDRKSVV